MVTCTVRPESKHMMHLLGCCWGHDQSNTHHDDTALLSEEQVIKVLEECYDRTLREWRWREEGRREKISNDGFGKSNTCGRTAMSESAYQCDR